MEKKGKTKSGKEFIGNLDNKEKKRLNSDPNTYYEMISFGGLSHNLVPL